MSYLDLEAKKMPGPGTYESPKSSITPKWTFKGRFSSELFPMTTSTTKKIVPGPGAHKLPSSIDPQGRYVLSKYKNSRSRVWNPKKSRRFGRSITEGPGPGTYDPHNGLSDSGHYLLSNHLSSGQRVILNHTGRSCFVDDLAKLAQSPGPGKYRFPSEFGIYDHKEQCPHTHSRHVSMTVEDERNAH